MQENLVSLDPANAEAGASRQRSQIYEQRVLEAKGGDVAQSLGLQFGLTAGIVSYASMRANGFRMFPMAMNKMPRYGALGIGYLAFYTFGTAIATQAVGNPNQL